MVQRRADRGLESADRALEPTERNSELAGKPRAIWEGQLRGQAGRGKNEENVMFVVCGGTIGHRSLQGRCPKTEL